MANVNELQRKTALKEVMERRKHNVQREQELCGIPPNELRLVIIGKSGNGKSSTANTIIGRDIFKTGATATSITKNTETYRASRFGKQILLVDTPGLFDPEIDGKETEREILRCMYMTLPGFHAFLLVVRIGRFTTEEMNTVKEFEKLFGEKLYDFMIIVFTRADELFREGKTLDDFVRHDLPQNLKQIIERCNHRYVGLNNNGSPKSKTQTVKNLLEMIETMIDLKDPNHYTNEAFEKAEKDLRETIKAEKEKKKAAKKAEFEEMFAEKENKMRAEHAITIKEMKDVFKEERKLLEEIANKRLETEKENMEASFANKFETMLAEENKIRNALLEDSVRETKIIQEEIQGIKDDNAELKGELEKKQKMEEDKINKLLEGIAEKENKMREEHAIKLEEMKGAWKEERQLQEENAKKRQEKEKENMEASFADELDKRLAKETEIRKKLIEDSERKKKEIQEEIQGIKDDNAELKGELEKKQKMEEDKINKLLEGIARKEKEDTAMYDKLKADREIDRLSYQANMMDERQKAHEKRVDERTEYNMRLLEDQRRRDAADYNRYIAQQTRIEAMQTEIKSLKPKSSCPIS